MLFSVVIAPGCGPAGVRAVSFLPAKRRAVPSAPGVGLTRHPMLGAAERRAVLLVNLVK